MLSADAVSLMSLYVTLVHHATVLVEVLLNSVCHDGACHGYCVDVFGDSVDSHICICVEGPGVEACRCTSSGIPASLLGHHDVHHW